MRASPSCRRKDFLGYAVGDLAVQAAVAEFRPLGLDLANDSSPKPRAGLWPDIRDGLREHREEVGGLRRQEAAGGELRIEIANAEAMPTALAAVRTLATPIVTVNGLGVTDLVVAAEGNVLAVTPLRGRATASDERTMQQFLEIIRRRVDEVGTREPKIMRQGEDCILIQVPGIGSATELESLIGTTAQLTFRSVVGRTSGDPAAADPGELILPSSEERGVSYILARAPVVSGENLVDASPPSIRTEGLR